MDTREDFSGLLRTRGLKGEREGGRMGGRERKGEGEEIKRVEGGKRRREERKVSGRAKV